jgi:hypothetical protein
MPTDVPEAIAAPAPRRSWPLAVLALLALASVVAGLVILQRAGAGEVNLIRVTRHSMIPEAVVGTPDYYLIVHTKDDQTITTNAYDDTPIGNGLDYKVSALQLENVASVELLDEDVGKDDIRDRVDVRERICRGQDYQFELIGPASPRKGTAEWILGGGGAVLVIAVILWVRSLAV